MSVLPRTDNIQKFYTTKIHVACCLQILSQQGGVEESVFDEWEAKILDFEDDNEIKEMLEIGKAFLAT